MTSHIKEQLLEMRTHKYVDFSVLWKLLFEMAEEIETLKSELADVQRYEKSD